MPAPDGPRGDDGEHATAVYLAARGHTIIDRNWRGHGGELDLVTLSDGVIHFVEVKTRRDSESVGGAWEAISAAKRARLTRTAEAWLQGATPPHDGCVFSVALVQRDGDELVVDFLEDAFDATR